MTGLTSHFPMHLAAHVVLMIPAAVVAGAFSSWCVTAHSKGHVATRGIVGGAFTAASLAGIYLPMILWIQNGGIAVGDLFAGGCLVLIGSIFFAAPFGAMVSLLFLPMLVPAWRARRSPSYAAADHVLVRGGLWLTALGMAMAAGVRLLFWDTDIDSFGGNQLPTAPLVTGVVTATIGAVVVCYGQNVERRRRQWVEDVKQGVVPGYRIVPIHELALTRPVTPMEHGQKESDAAIVRVADPVAASYRRAAVEAIDEPLALVRRAQ